MNVLFIDFNLFSTLFPVFFFCRCDHMIINQDYATETNCIVIRTLLMLYKVLPIALGGLSSLDSAAGRPSS